MINFCINAIKELEKLSGKEFAEAFINKKSEFFHKFQNELITSSYHGLDFFQNVIKYHNEQDNYRLLFSKNKNKKLDSIYEENFITMLKNNK